MAESHLHTEHKPDTKPGDKPEEKAGPPVMKDDVKGPQRVAASPVEPLVPEKPKVIDATTHDGLGGPLAVETRNGLVKALAGDTVVYLSNGKAFVIVSEAEEYGGDAKKITDKKAADKKKADEEAKKAAEPEDKKPEDKPAEKK